MKKIRNFFVNVSLGGLLVILPIVIVYKIALWFFFLISDTAQPLTFALMKHADLSRTTALVLTFILIFLLCFLLGLVLRTAAGHGLFTFIQSTILNRIPGYKTVNEIISQFTSNRNRIFSKVVIVTISDRDLRLIGFVVDEYDPDQYSVFIPTAPNPTSGFIVQTSGKNLEFLTIPVEMAMKCIISCGVGSSRLIGAKTADTHPDSK